MRMPPALGAFLVALTALGCAPLPYSLTETRDTIVAIDVALQPDAAPGTAATSHITLVRHFVRGNDLHLVSSVVAQVMATTTLEGLNLKVTGDRIDVSPGLRRLEERMVEAIRPFVVNPETAKAFIVTPDRSRMSEETIHAVERFVPDASGVNYRPQITAGAAQTEASTFTPAGAAIYQLGPGGTADRMLWTWTGESGAKEP